MAETNFTSYDEVLKSGLIGDILYLVISEKEQLRTYKDLSAFLGGAVGILPFVVGGLSSLYENMDTQTYFGKTQKEMIDGYSTSCLPPGKEGNDTGWGCYSQKFWYDGMKLFLNSPDSKSVQDKAWISKTKPEIENVLTKGWKTKRQITIALTLSIKLGQDTFKSIAESNAWDAEKTLQAFVNKTSDQKTKKSIDDNFPYTSNTSPNSIAENKPEIPKGPDFPEDKIYTFNVTDSNFLVSSEIGTFSVVDFNPEIDFEQDFDEVPLDDEYYEEQFAGAEEETIDLAVIQHTTIVDNAEPSEIIKKYSDGDDKVTITSIKGGKKWDALKDSQELNAIYLYKTALEYGFNDIEARAMISVVSKESAFAPRPEISYKNTSVSRIRFVFPGIFGSEKKKKISDDEITTLKSNDKNFWNKVYGNKCGNGPDDGWRYLGRGFNGLTFKGSDKDLSGYIGFNILYKRNGSKAGPIDIVNDPELVNKKEGGIYKVASHLCCLYFQKGKNKHFSKDDNTNIDKVIFNFMRSNAGWSSDTSGNIFQEGLAKAKAFAASLPSKIQ